MKFKDLLRRMQQQGWEEFRPALISKEGIIGDGNRRYCAARILGMDEIPVVFTDRTHPELFEGNTGMDMVSATDWLGAYCNRLAGIDSMPASVAENIRQLEAIGGKALLQFLIDHNTSPKVWDVTYRVGRHCEDTSLEFLVKVTQWLVLRRMQNNIVGLIRDRIIDKRTLHQAIEHQLNLHEAMLEADDEEILD